jgi:raffinose synthase
MIIDRMISPRLLLLLLLYAADTCCRTHAFTNPLHGKLCPRRPFTGGVSSSLQVATEPRLPELINQQPEDDDDDKIFKRKQPIIDDDEPSSSDRYRLELNQKGHLRIHDGPVILDGLLPSTWTGMAPTVSEEEDGFSSLFLRATYSKEKAVHETTLGHLHSCHRLLAVARVTRYWMGPAFGNSVKDIPLDTQFLLVELEKDGPYALILPLVDAGFRATLQASDDKHNMKVISYSESGDASASSSGMLALYVSVGDDPFELLKRGFQQVADDTGTFCTLDQKQLPPSVDDFGWCTWDAFYSKVDPAGILKGVSELKEAGVPPRNLILDDGWQQVAPYPKDWTKDSDDESSTKASASSRGVISRMVNYVLARGARVLANYYTTKAERASYGTFHNRVWAFLSHTVLKQGLWNFFDTETDFARQLDGFKPNFKFDKDKANADDDGEVTSLKEMVTKLKTELGVKHVYCWHAIHGYWRGVSNELGDAIGIDVTQFYPKATDHLLRLEPQAEFDPPSLFGVGLIQTEKDLATFYRHIHEPLVKAGIDGVKVDVQSGVSAAGSGISGGPHMAKLYTQAMEKSVSEHFASDDTTKDGAVNCINCMCHSTENLYRYKVTSVARASEDFFPERPETHSVHLINVAYNSLFLGEICLPDWDMFHSKHESAELHAAARAIGGCPVYVSDVPGQHDATLLKKLVLPDGSILRAQLPGRPTRDCLFADVGTDGTTALKIWNQNKAGGGVVGAFHVQGVAWNFDSNKNDVLDASPPPLTASVKPYDVETLRNHKGPFAVWSHRSSSLEILENGDSTIETPMNHREFEIFTVAPVQTSDHVSWAPIGLRDMLNSGGALSNAGPLEQALTTTNSTSDGRWRHTNTAGIKTRGPGRFVAYCQPAPSTILICDGTRKISSELSFSHDEKTGMLSFYLPNETEEGRPHELTVVWDHPV